MRTLQPSLTAGVPFQAPEVPQLARRHLASSLEAAYAVEKIDRHYLPSTAIYRAAKASSCRL
ncbi:BQ5605_C031g10918 [Microbotryum silenes-dioicae]|uniref:BQ5605_C031g10918 protein n=1 Tax=Microbotryum silenes-dioicae TaxID=796604 RepID=A0A2X0MHP0_9BASI|nr:BQ5605_C031g10918 [Microbotryum silenes-dioicae]